MQDIILNVIDFLILSFTCSLYLMSHLVSSISFRPSFLFTTQSQVEIRAVVPGILEETYADLETVVTTKSPLYKVKGRDESVVLPLPLPPPPPFLLPYPTADEVYVHIASLPDHMSNLPSILL